MNDNFLLETIRVMLGYGWAQIACGLAISSLLVAWASRLARIKWSRLVLSAAVIVLWISLFLAADSGYRAWQSIRTPPEEAFSDTGPIAILLLGWLPCLILVLLGWSAVRFFSRNTSHRYSNSPEEGLG